MRGKSFPGAERFFLALAKQLGVGQRTIERLLGSFLVSLDTEGDADPASAQRFELGLRLIERIRENNPAPLVQSEGFVTLVQEALHEYQRVCPALFAALSRVSTKPDQVAAKLPRAKLLHAARSAGRLRARLSRALS